MSSGDDHDAPPRRRLRVPAALAVAFAGSSAAISVWYGGCHSATDPPLDATIIESRGDANVDVDAGAPDAEPADAGPPSDGALPPDGPDH